MNIDLKLLFYIVKERLSIIDPKSIERGMYKKVYELHQCETGETVFLLEKFFTFLRERGYILRKKRKIKNIEFRNINDFFMKEDEGKILINPISLTIEEKNKPILSVNYIPEILEDRDLFDVFLSENTNKGNNFIDELNHIDLSIYILDYIFYTLNILGFSLYYGVRKPKIEVNKEIEESREIKRDHFASLLLEGFKNGK